MNEYIIDVTKIEELQTIRNLNALELIFERAKRTIVQGGTVVLVRKTADGQTIKFDDISNENDFGEYRKTVFKYL